MEFRGKLNIVFGPLQWAGRSHCPTFTKAHLYGSTYVYGT